MNGSHKAFKLRNLLLSAENFSKQVVWGDIWSCVAQCQGHS